MLPHGADIGRRSATLTDHSQMAASLSLRQTIGRVRRGDPRLLFVAGFLLVTLLFPLAMGPYAHFSIDEGIYHLMARAFWTDGGLHVWNGYEDFAAPELVLWFLHVHDGMLAPQYPSFYAVLAAPFFGLAGFSGLVLLNGLAYAATAFLCFAITRRLFDDRELAIAACLIYLLATFGWEYSQGAWPHALATLFVAAAFYLGVVAVTAGRRATVIWAALGAGLVAGFGVGIRVDAVLVVPAVAVPLLFAKPARVLAVFALGAGMVPGLAFLTYANTVKFGIASPLSYGPARPGQATDPLSYLPIAAAAALVLLMIWLATRDRSRAALANSGLRGGVILAAAIGAVAALWLLWPRVVWFTEGFFQLVVDMRVRDVMEEPALMRGPGGSMVYLGAIKKSLLQSCPYLAALIIPLAALVRRRDDAPRLAMLFLVPAAYIALFSFKAWHGGLSLNLRYFTPILPFTSILAAHALRDLTGFEPLPARWSALTAPRFVILWLLLLLWAGMGVVDPMHEFVVLNTPLAIAALLLVLSLVWAVSSGRTPAATTRLRALTAVTLTAGLAWAGAVSYGYDATRAIQTRAARAALSAEPVGLVSTDSLVLVDYPDSLFHTIAKDRVRLAMIDVDDLSRTRPLIDHHLKAGRAVYLWVEPGNIEAVDRATGASGLKIDTLHENALGRLSRIGRSSN